MCNTASTESYMFNYITKNYLKNAAGLATVNTHICRCAKNVRESYFRAAIV